MQQILVIRGGEVFDTHEEYVQFLQDKKITLEDIRFNDWKKTLGEKLGENYDVLLPQMPNNYFAQFSEWKIIFEKIVHLLDDGVILIGTSLGGIFLAKYLSENNFPKTIKAIFLLAPPYSTRADSPLGDFILTNDLSQLAQKSDRIFIYQSKDDQVVPFSDCEKYMKLLSNAKLKVFTDRGHFRLKEFPEIIEDLKLISKD